MKVKIYISGIVIFIIALVIVYLQLQELRNIDKFLIYYNFDTNEICKLDIKTGRITEKHRIEMEILRGGAINSRNFSHRWFYKENDNNVYLLERSLYRGTTKMYEINLDNFIMTEIFQTGVYYYDFFIDNNDLYLLNYIEQSNEKHNKELNYIVLHNLQTNNETIINFNELLPEDEQVYVTSFYIHNNKIIFSGYTDISEIVHKKLYLYDIAENTINAIDEYVINFTIRNNTILYDKYTNVEIIIDDDSAKTFIFNNTSLNLFNLDDGAYSTLPYQENYYFDYLIIDENRIIYSNWFISDAPYYNENAHPFIHEMPASYYIVNVNKPGKKILFSSSDKIMLLGILNKN